MLSHIVVLRVFDMGSKFHVPEFVQKADAAGIEEHATRPPINVVFPNLLLPILRFPDASINRVSVQAIADKLSARSSSEDAGALLYRYLREDDFGQPEDAFLVCSFWLAQAYAAIGEKEQGRQLLRKLIAYATPQGLYPEHVSLTNARHHSGNFPQTYSHVGLINAAFSLSPDWREIL